jgi:hypothetical protein
LEGFSLGFLDGFLKGFSLKFILPPPPPHAMVFVLIVPVFPPAAGWHQRCILPPQLPCAILFVSVFLPAANQCSASTSTLHPTTATATCGLRCLCCPCPCPCSCYLLTSRIKDASSRPHCHVQSLLLSSSPSLSLSPPPVDIARQCCILLPPLPCAIVILVIVPTACQH